MPESNERIVAALAAAGIHAADCEEGMRNSAQKNTGMYLTHRPCTCWVESKEAESTYVCD